MMIFIFRASVGFIMAAVPFHCSRDIKVVSGKVQRGVETRQEAD
jgi:hypothetical protein